MSFIKTSHRSLSTPLALLAIVFALASATATADCATTCLQAGANAEQQVRSVASQVISTGCAQAASSGDPYAYDACVDAINSQINTAAINVRNSVITQCMANCYGPQ